MEADRISGMIQSAKGDDTKLEEVIGEVEGMLIKKLEQHQIIPGLLNIKFERKTSEETRKTEGRLRYCVLICYGLQLVISMIDLSVSPNSNQTSNVQDLQSEYTLMGFDIAQITLILITMYTLVVHANLQEKIASRDDPFNTGSVLAILIFIVVL